MKRAAAACAVALAALAGATTGRSAATTCRLAEPVRHLIFVELHDTHLRRDDPNTPSDLEQLPHLLSFLRDNGALLVNHHTALPSEATTGVLTSLTGVYPDRFGQPFATGIANAYWTDFAGDGRPVLLDRRGKTSPAPWVPFTRAGCDVGTVGMPGLAPAAGIAVHCALDSPVCAAGVPDLLPDEPGGYPGFRGLFIPGDLGLQPAAGPVPAAEALADVASLQEQGVSITYAYVAVEQAGSADGAFADFFARLAAKGIDRQNTLFVFTSDQGSAGRPAEADLAALPHDGSFSVDQGSVAAFRIEGRRKSQPVRDLERATAGLTGVVAVADPIGLSALHMVTASPRRTPAFVAFAAPGWFLGHGPAPDVATGGLDSAMTQTWAGFVGPGVRVLGQSTVWSDHADLRPTVLALLGLHDDYADDGRVLAELLEHRPSKAVVGLAQLAKQLTAPLGKFGTAALKISTAALASAQSTTYDSLESSLATLTRGRNALADQIRSALADPALADRHAAALANAAGTVLKWAARVAAGSALP